MAQHFAVECPQRVEGLALVNAPAPAVDGDLIRESSGDRHRSSSEILADWLPVADSWGEDATAAARLLSPSQLDNESYVRWMNRYHRLAASPADFQRQLSSVVGLSADLRPDRIEAPTIVVQLRDDRVIPVGNGRVLAGRIPDAQLVEVDGGDHFAISQGNWRDVFDPIITFFTGTRPPVSVTRRFAAVMFTDIVNSTALASSMGDVRWLEVIGDHDRLAHRVIAEQAGRVIKSTGDGVLAIFDAPSSAIAVATRLRDELAEHGLTIRVGVHAGEIEEHPDGDISGVAVNLAARVEQAAPDGSIVVSSTMKDMLLGSGTTFEDRGPHELKGVGGRWNLYEVA